MRLPNAERAVIDPDKLRNYCLNLQHPRGKNKARVFASALGIMADDWKILKDAILEAILTEPAGPGEKDAFGQRYTVDFELTVGRRSATVRSSWIILTDEDFPRLTSCYIL